MCIFNRINILKIIIRIKNTHFLFCTCFYYNLFTTLCPISAVQQSDPVIHTHTFPFSHYLPPWSIPRDWVQFPVLYSRTSLLYHSECNSWHLPAPTPNPSHSLPRYPLATTSLENRHFFFFFFRATPRAYGSSQARDRTGATAASHSHNHYKI